MTVDGGKKRGVVIGHAPFFFEMLIFYHENPVLKTDISWQTENTLPGNPALSSLVQRNLKGPDWQFATANSPQGCKQGHKTGCEMGRCFEKKTAWAHADIAGMAVADSEFSGQKSAMGFVPQIINHISYLINHKSPTVLVLWAKTNRDEYRGGFMIDEV